jgi:signal transduction histidine kinase/ActR/RegA family two-component response regulator
MPVCVGELAEKVRLVRAETPFRSLVKGLLSDSECFWLTLVRNKRPVGIVSRGRVLELAVQSDAATQDTMTAADVAVVKPLIVDASVSVLDFADVHRADGYARIRSGCIVTGDKKYLGVLTLSALMTAVTEARTIARVMPVAAPKAPDMPKAEAKGQGLLLGTLAHEIRTPLTAMMGLADVLASRTQDGAHRELAQTIVQSGDALDRILKDTFDYARLGAGQLDKSVEDADLNGLVNDMRKLWGAQASKRGLSLRVTFRPDGPYRIQTDLGRVRQIVNNLVSNALKFTREGEVAISIGTQVLGSQLMLGIEVSDTGRGIPDAQKEAFFEAFRTGDANKDAPGWGLGLTISKALTTHMGGNLSVADNPSGGSVFTLLVPVEHCAPLHVEVSESLPRKGMFAPGRVLLVEDHEACAMVVIDALETAGWKVQHAATIERAEAMAAHYGFQAIITDLHLTDGSGLTLIDAIRRRGGPSANAPIFALTADITEGSKKAALAMGADQAMSKPIKGPALVAMLADALIMRTADNGRVRLRGRLAAKLFHCVF